jgi:hypothetical protein
VTGRIERPATLWQAAPSMVTHRASLVYDPADPYAVAIEFPGPPGRHHRADRWVFARELLVDAVELSHTTGAGDVHIEPEDEADLTPQDTRWLTITLLPGRPSALELLLQHDVAAEFLNATYAAVPVGTETCHINWADPDEIPFIGAATIHAIVHTMSGMYRAAMKEHPPLVVSNPFSELELPCLDAGEVQYYEADEIEALYAALERLHGQRWRTLPSSGWTSACGRASCTACTGTASTGSAGT